jgi:hypothetical protein
MIQGGLAGDEEKKVGEELMLKGQERTGPTT